MSVINVIFFDLDLAKSELLYDFKKFDPQDWTIVRHSPPWQVTPQAIIGGQPDEPEHGQIFYKTPVEGDIVMEFDAELIGDSYHDIIWWWSTSLAEKPWGAGYLGCLGGWWHDYAGIEKTPEFTPSCISPSFHLEQHKSYHIISGGVGKMQFIVVDGKLITFFSDATPAKSGYFGFGVYGSHVCYRNLKVYRPSVTMLPEGVYLLDSEYAKTQH